ncbi:MAG TPA: phosphotransferase [bacterium]|nr:phosphotransferase [bacterium]
MKKQFCLKQIKNNFPDLKFKKSEIIDYGWNKTVIVLDKKIVFTFPKNKEARSKFIVELEILPKLSKKITLPIPNFDFIPVDKSFAGYNYVSGEPLTIKDFKELNPSQQNKIAKQVAEFLNELHNFSLTKAKKAGVSMAWSEKEVRNYYTEQAETVYKKLSSSDKKLLKNIFENYCNGKIKTDFNKVVVHQDLTSDHILFNENTKKVCGIIDFGDIQISDPAVDFSKLWEYSEKFVDKVLAGYHSNDKQLKFRSYRWYIYQCIGNMYCGITMKRKDYWQKGYGLLKLAKKMNEKVC